MKDTLTSFDNIFWQLCQYPWHYIVNILMAAAFFALAVRMHLADSISRRFGWTVPARFRPTVMVVCDILLGFLALTAIFTTIAITFLLHKGISFIVVGYSFYFWFLFCPVYVSYIALKHRNMVTPAICTGALCIVILCLSLFYFPNQIRQQTVTLKTSAVTKPYRIIQLADIQAEHFGSREANLLEMVNSLHPDLVLISGDLFSTPRRQNTAGFAAVCRIINELHPRHGVLFVEGHHDRGETRDIPSLTRERSVFIGDKWHRIDCPDARISIYGANVNATGTAYDHPEYKPGDFVIYLGHTPALPSLSRQAHCDLFLFGHTHGGQIYLPWISEHIAGNLLHGRYDVEGRTVIVNSGVGMEGLMSPRIRWMVFPEIVLVDLMPAG